MSAEKIIVAQPLTRESFAPFGEVIDFDTDSHYPINNGRCERYHALAKPEAAGPNGHVLISLFHGTPYDFPLELTMVERHPFGSQAFVPLSQRPFVVVVCADGRFKVSRVQPADGKKVEAGEWAKSANLAVKARLT